MELDRTQNNNEQIILAPSEVCDSSVLSSNSSLSVHTSLGGNYSSEQEELLIDNLADLLVDIYLYAKRKRS